MKTRAITGFFFVIVMLGSVLLGPYPFGIFYLLLIILCLREFYGLIKQSGFKPNLVWGLINGLFIYSVFALIPFTNALIFHKLLFLIPVALSIVFIQELFNKTEAPFSNIAYTFLGLILICI